MILQLWPDTGSLSSSVRNYDSSRTPGRIPLLGWTGFLAVFVPLTSGAQPLPSDLSDEPQFRTKVYGFIDAFWEKVANTPSGVGPDGTTQFQANPHEFDVPNLNVMVQSRFGDNFTGFLNLRAPGAQELGVQNAWVEAAVFGQRLAVRAGKMYRRFGLYNEILDAVPTYIGIEPPELFDGDHLLLTRTTNLMIHGDTIWGAHSFSYSITTGNDERAGNQIPIGADLHYDYLGNLRVGSSFYTSNGNASPLSSVGEGPASGGVAPWMARDRFYAYGLYAQVAYRGWLVQTEWWQAKHKGTRDPQAVLELIDAGLNPRQRRRFGLDGADPTADDVRTKANYTVQTVYVRVGYAFEGSVGEITPYGQYDFYENPEIIAAKAFGGDNEAGLADDGRFHKATVGVVWRPVSPLALKIDASTHTQKFNGQTETYPEIRSSLSYLWSL